MMLHDPARSIRRFSTAAIVALLVLAWTDRAAAQTVPRPHADIYS